MCIMFYNETVVASPCQGIPPTTRSSKAVAESALVHRPTRPVRRRGGRAAVLRRASPVCGRRWRPHEADAIDPWAAPSRARSRAVAGHGRRSRGRSCPRAHSRARAGRSSRPGIHRWPPRPAGGPVLGATTGGPGAPDAKRARVAGGAGLAGQGSAWERAFILPTILRFTKAKVSPRAMRYEFEPGQDARLVLEPWEQRIPLRGAEHGYAEPRVIRT